MADIKPELIGRAADVIMDLYITGATRAALSAVADDLRAEGAAQALRDAAETLEGATPRHLGESDLDYLDYDTDVEYGINRAAEYLRARARALEVGND